MTEGSGKTAIVTGASSGIGKAFAELLAGRGYALVLTARRRDRLDALAATLRQRHGIETHTIVADLADPGASARIVSQLAERRLAIDVLVNNAGYGVPGSYVNVTWADHERFVQVMVLAVCDLTYRLLPPMIERGWGRIINIASVAGMVPAPAGHTLYGASKAFLIRFSEALSAEGAPKGVHVTAVCPGFTHSEFHDVLGTRDRKRDAFEPGGQFPVRQAAGHLDTLELLLLEQLEELHEVREIRVVHEKLPAFHVEDQLLHGLKKALEILVKFLDSLDDEGTVGGIKRNVTQRRPKITRHLDEGRLLGLRNRRHLNFFHVLLRGGGIRTVFQAVKNGL